MQALLNHRDRFMVTNLGCTGRVHNARVFSRSGLCLHGQAGRLFPLNDIVIKGVIVPTVILGNPDYPLLPLLMKTYSEDGVDVHMAD